MRKRQKYSTSKHHSNRNVLEVNADSLDRHAKTKQDTNCKE